MSRSPPLGHEVVYDAAAPHANVVQGPVQRELFGGARVGEVAFEAQPICPESLASVCRHRVREAPVELVQGGRLSRRGRSGRGAHVRLGPEVAALVLLAAAARARLVAADAAASPLAPQRVLDLLAEQVEGRIRCCQADREPRLADVRL